MMTNEQRKRLLGACQESYFIQSRPRDEYVKIRFSNILIKVDYCLKHDTGTGKVCFVALSPPYDGKDWPTSAEIDQKLIDMAKWHCNDLSQTKNNLNEILEELSKEDNHD